MDASQTASSVVAHTNAGNQDEGLCLLETVEDILHRHQAIASENCSRLGCHIAPALPSRIIIDSLLLRETLNELTSCMLEQARNGEICLEFHCHEDVNHYPGQQLAVEILMRPSDGMLGQRLKLSEDVYNRVNERLSEHGGELQLINRRDESGLFFSLPYETCVHQFADHAQPQSRILILEADREERATVHRSLIELSPDVRFVENEDELDDSLSTSSPAGLLVIGLPGSITAEHLALITHLRGRHKQALPTLFLCREDEDPGLPALCMRLGKPIRKKGLMRVANRLIREGRNARPQKQRHVLVAEDNPINLKVISKLLSHHGIEYSIATDGQAALDIFRERDIDLILMDIHMPGMDGIEATRQIRGLGERGQQVPVIAMTADTLHETRHRCRSAGINDALIKPLVLEDIQTSVMSWLYDETDMDLELPEDTNPVQAIHGELQEMLQEMLPGYLLELRKADKAGDRTGLCDVAHALAGAASYCQATDLKRCALELQDKLHEAEMPDYSRDMNALVEAIQSLMLDPNLAPCSGAGP